MLTLLRDNCNIMMQDISIDVPGVSVKIRQSDLSSLYQSNRLSDQVLVYRVVRTQLGGGFGDQSKHPYAWAVMVTVDGSRARVVSARGAGREWNSLDRLERWLREQGFRAWTVRNDLEPVGQRNDNDNGQHNLSVADK